MIFYDKADIWIFFDSHHLVWFCNRLKVLVYVSIKFYVNYFWVWKFLKLWEIAFPNKMLQRSNVVHIIQGMKVGVLFHLTNYFDTSQSTSYFRICIYHFILLLDMLPSEYTKVLFGQKVQKSYHLWKNWKHCIRWQRKIIKLISDDNIL